MLVFLVQTSHLDTTYCLTPWPSSPDHCQWVEVRRNGYDHLQPARTSQTRHPLGRHGLETPGVHQDQVTYSNRVKGMEEKESDVKEVERTLSLSRQFPGKRGRGSVEKVWLPDGILLYCTSVTQTCDGAELTSGWAAPFDISVTV